MNHAFSCRSFHLRACLTLCSFLFPSSSSSSSLQLSSQSLSSVAAHHSTATAKQDSHKTASSHICLLLNKQINTPYLRDKQLLPSSNMPRARPRTMRKRTADPTLAPQAPELMPRTRRPYAQLHNKKTSRAPAPKFATASAPTAHRASRTASSPTRLQLHATSTSQACILVALKGRVSRTTRSARSLSQR